LFQELSGKFRFHAASLRSRADAGRAQHYRDYVSLTV
jgi:hypothetical protein